MFNSKKAMLGGMALMVASSALTTVKAPGMIHVDHETGPVTTQVMEGQNCYTDATTRQEAQDMVIGAYERSGGVVPVSINYHDLESQNINQDSMYDLVADEVNPQLNKMGFNDELSSWNETVIHLSSKQTQNSHGYNLHQTLTDDNGDNMHVSFQYNGDAHEDGHDMTSYFTKWDTAGFELSEGLETTNIQEYCATSHHEMGHATDFHEQEVHKFGGGRDFHGPGSEMFVTENIGDVNQVLQLTREGADKSTVIKQIQMDRSYALLTGAGSTPESAVNHYSVDVLNVLEDVPDEFIQGMDANALSKYAIEFVENGDPSIGLDSSPVPSAEEFNEIKNGIDDFRAQVKEESSKIFEGQDEDQALTPKQVKKLLEVSGDEFQGFGKKLLTDIASYEDMVKSGTDFKYGLTDDPRAEELYNAVQAKAERQAAIDSDVVPEYIKLKAEPEDFTPSEKFYKNVQRTVWPENKDGFTKIHADERMEKLESLQKSLDEDKINTSGATKDEAQIVLDFHRGEITNLNSYKASQANKVVSNSSPDQVVDSLDNLEHDMGVEPQLEQNISRGK
jgi:hypothetical protein